MAGGRGQYLTNLRFADDVLLVGRTLHQVKEMLSDLVDKASKVGLSIHPGKTKILNNGVGQAQKQKSVEVNGRNIEILGRDSSTMYLGRLLNLCELTDTEINFRIKRAWAKFGMYKKELTDKDYSLFERLRLFHAVVTPTVLYGCCSWPMTGAREQTLRTAQRKMLRSILGHGRKIIEQTGDATSSNSSEEDDEVDDQEVRESWVQWKRRVTGEALDASKKIGLPDWADEQRRRIFRWAGHVARRNDGRWTKQTLYWTPSGHRKPGHPRRRFEDVLQEHFKFYHPKESWTRRAQDRDEWKREEEKFTNFYNLNFETCN